jgi:hypothetical protein
MLQGYKEREKTRRTRDANAVCSLIQGMRAGKRTVNLRRIHREIVGRELTHRIERTDTLAWILEKSHERARKARCLQGQR